MDLELTGGCLCGEARYVVRRTLQFQPYACHCADCQTRSGSAFAMQQMVFVSELTVTGDLVTGTRVQPSGAVATIHACPRCLTQLYASNDRRPGMVTLRAGTLDNSRALVPGFHLWNSSRQSWVVIPPDVPVLATQPSDLAEWQRLLTGDRTKP